MGRVLIPPPYAFPPDRNQLLWERQDRWEQALRDFRWICGFCTLVPLGITAYAIASYLISGSGLWHPRIWAVVGLAVLVCSIGVGLACHELRLTKLRLIQEELE